MLIAMYLTYAFQKQSAAVWKTRLKKKPCDKCDLFYASK